MSLKNLSGMLWYAAEMGFQGGIRRSTKTLFILHSQQGGQRNCYCPGRWRSKLVGLHLIEHFFKRETANQPLRCRGNRKVRDMTHRSNICLKTRKQIAMGIVGQRSCILGKTLPSWSFKSSQPWPWGNQIQSAQISSLKRDNILQTKQKEAFCIWRKEIKTSIKKKILSAWWVLLRFSLR